MFKLLGVIGRASGLLIAGAGVGVGVSKSDEIAQAAKDTSTGLKVVAVGVAVYLVTKSFK